VNRSDAASLTADLLVTKGHAGPSRRVAPRLGDRIALGALYGVVPPHHTPPQNLEPLHGTPAKAHQPARLFLRLDEGRQHRLRLAAAHLGKTSQAVLQAALDHYLTRVMPGLLGERCPCIEGEGGAASACCSGSKTL